MYTLRGLNILDKCRLNLFKTFSRNDILRKCSSAGESVQPLERDLIEVLELRKSNISNWIIENKARALCCKYGISDKKQKHKFIETLALQHNFQRQSVTDAAKHFLQVTTEDEIVESEQFLKKSLVPSYYWLFTAIGRIENGVKFLVDLRTNVLEILGQSPDKHIKTSVRQLNSVLQDLLLLWFSVGFLYLERITWESSCDIIEKVSKYEAIHPVRNWLDLKHRLGAYRRCYVFTHPAMPREPLIVLHTALCSKIPEKLKQIEEYTATNNNEEQSSFSKEDSSKVKSAIFYSISATQKGLAGIQLGYYLIKEVVNEVMTEFPTIYEFSSLSPIPGFKDWLLNEVKKDVSLIFTTKECQAVQEVLNNCNVMESLSKLFLNSLWTENEEVCRVLKNPLIRACARYLYMEKKQGYALNKVAHFHLSNGAVIWRINWMAHTSPRIVAASCGMMVNYRYYLNECEKNSRNYIENYYINIGENVSQFIKTDSETEE